MPLSEHEQKLLDELEKQLASEDPRFAKNINPEPVAGLSARRVVLGILTMIAGAVLAVLAISFAASSGPLAIALGVAGFGVMVAGGLLAFSPGKGRSGGSASPLGGSGRSTSPGGGSGGGANGKNFMQKMEDRWERRRNEGGR
ncbi:DUF3040 domain-containing protein [Sediminivirga luteola]|jgi:uncharacterized membrane protein YgcG|uniref:DUF3040 domain-containing protein n=1 Tax=Sediminivirga luteola TaxID=1774748 RepID=A0A8J2TZN8_9MICO|nr:DUF3040 domain-containing protein [Sediminivirga luteola]MCI2266922.1 DUF3040 domain-containing protein [Sediminivirga luteola]GGA21168.1 hypothetical protein GCM10011333_25360 [Sediminivirga luteola]